MTRLRLLRLLEREELSVREMASIMQLPQSTVSRHLKVLLEGNWIGRRSDGTAGRYHLSIDDMSQESRDLWRVARDQLGETPQVLQDINRLKRVLAERATDSADYFGRVGAEWDAVRTEMFGRAFGDEALVAMLDPASVVADLGCGTGNLIGRFAPFVSTVHAVDSSASMLDAARDSLGRYTNVKFHQADLLDLPLPEQSVDIAVLSLVLHHIESPLRAIESASRLLRPGCGRLLVVDMFAHDRVEYRQAMGHRHLGFQPDTIQQWFCESSLEVSHLWRLSPDPDASGPDLFAAIGARMGE
jgi:ubiquinone/menaquinone biosynthesis C-methylase UbiE/DNA-binding transcriptional ArsR family regulator